MESKSCLNGLKKNLLEIVIHYWVIHLSLACVFMCMYEGWLKSESQPFTYMYEDWQKSESQPFTCMYEKWLKSEPQPFMYMYEEWLKSESQPFINPICLYEVHNLMVIIVGNRHNNLSSNPG